VPLYQLTLVNMYNGRKMVVAVTVTQHSAVSTFTGLTVVD